MSYLAYALDTMEHVKNVLEGDNTESKERLIKELKKTIEDIKKTKKDICVTCEYDEYYSDRYTPPTNTCGCEQSEFYGADCPLWYGDEECPCYKNQVWED